MIGRRLRKANIIAEKRMNRGIWGVCGVGGLRKNNTVCSCQMCCNPRHCDWNPDKIKLTIQERKAPAANKEWY